jgi:hypothetical protein
MGDREVPTAIIFLVEELIVHLKIVVCGSQTNLQQFHDGVHMKDRSASVIVMKLVTDDLHGFVDWYISEKTDVKATKSIERLKDNRFQQYTKWSVFLTKGCDYPATALSILCRKPAQA